MSPHRKTIGARVPWVRAAIGSLAAFALALLSGLAPAPARAEFLWLGPWSGQSSGTGRSGFYYPEGRTLSASAFVSLSAPDQSTYGSINLSRPFRLSGSPAGWVVQLYGSGQASYDKFPNYYAFAGGSLSVGSAQSTVFSRSLGAQGGPGSGSDYLFVSQGLTLPDGDYVLRADFTASASQIYGSFPLPGAFASASGSLSVAILSATAVPEPPAGVLLALGGAAALAGLRAPIRARPGAGPRG